MGKSKSTLSPKLKVQKPVPVLNKPVKADFNLTGANLTGANLTRANLEAVNIHQANFQDVKADERVAEQIRAFRAKELSPKFG